MASRSFIVCNVNVIRVAVLVNISIHRTTPQIHLTKSLAGLFKERSSGCKLLVQFAVVNTVST